jgi:hypothetical protein
VDGDVSVFKLGSVVRLCPEQFPVSKGSGLVPSY